VTNRRDLILGGACVIGSGAALALKPRRKVTLMAEGKKLSNILPRKFGEWESSDVSDLYAPQTPDSLLAQLYGQTVGRIFIHRASRVQIMMLAAHGDSQSNELQLHRPEVCYPAFGFALLDSRPIELSIAKAVTLPGRRLIAQSSLQKQAVIYWTRLGETFPVTVTEQRLARLNSAMHRYSPDGLLARFSVAGTDTEASFTSMRSFISDLVMEVAAADRGVLVGSERAARLGGGGLASKSVRKA
jgi:EpsI family protein